MSHSRSPSVTTQGLPLPTQVNTLDLVPIRHRKSRSTGGGRAWSDEEVTGTIQQILVKLRISSNTSTGNISARGTPAQNALQAHF